MSDTHLTDVHAPYVHQLDEAGDWTALVRYWIAHQYEPALDAAIAVVLRRQESATQRWRELAEFLVQVREQPLDSRREPARELLEGLPPMGQRTLHLLVLYPLMALCEMSGQCPVEQQQRLFEMGIHATEQCQTVAVAVQDSALVAFCDVILAGGLRRLRQLEIARASFDKALAAYRDLSRLRPEVYRPLVAGTLNNLGNAQRELNDLEAARVSFDEALAIRRELGRLRPEASRPPVGPTCNNLGNVLSALNDLKEARASFDEAHAASCELVSSTALRWAI